MGIKRLLMKIVGADPNLVWRNPLKTSEVRYYCGGQFSLKVYRNTNNVDIISVPEDKTKFLSWCEKSLIHEHVINACKDFYDNKERLIRLEKLNKINSI